MHQSHSTQKQGMVHIPEGEFLYGWEEEPLYGEGESSKWIPYDYWMDVHPVTNAQFNAFVEAGGYKTESYWSKEGWQWKKKGKEGWWSWKKKENIQQPAFWDDPRWNKSRHPVVGVSYYEAEAYAKWAGNRLPTELEWEKAARGTEGWKYPWGEKFDRTKCNWRKAGIDETSPVELFPNGKSPYGCYDMAGNVWEWCASWSENKKRRILRGGSWKDMPTSLQSAVRFSPYPTPRTNYTGFRCVQDAP